jgi:hypothetical protein
VERTAVLERQASQLCGRSVRDEHDEHLEAQVDRALRRTGYSELRRVSFLAQGERAVLTGVVPTYYLKQVAQTAALTVPGVRTLRNEIVVRPQTNSRECAR